MPSKAMDAKAAPFDDALETLIRRLHARGRPRVWSLVVTVFGDAVVPRGGRVALAALQELTGRLGVEPGALRTAMSRLAADGWVVRERVGRNSFFELAAGGRHAFDLATRRIYASGPPNWSGGWTVAIAPPATAVAEDELTGNGFIRVVPGVFLKPDLAGKGEAAVSLSHMLVIHGSSAEHPEALSALWPLREVGQAYRDLLAAWQPIAKLLRERPSPSPIAAMAARTLLIHDWRRIVLRDPGLPGALLPEDWPGEDARALVRGVYADLAAPSEAWLEGAGMPAPGDPSAFAARFKQNVPPRAG
jgi:phenylacetic acid degradation operon negative regulatory protein